MNEKKTRKAQTLHLHTCICLQATSPDTYILHTAPCQDQPPTEQRPRLPSTPKSPQRTRKRGANISKKLSFLLQKPVIPRYTYIDQETSRSQSWSQGAVPTYPLPLSRLPSILPSTTQRNPARSPPAHDSVPRVIADQIFLPIHATRREEHRNPRRGGTSLARETGSHARGVRVP
jgi:hypothetical protein